MRTSQAYLPLSVVRRIIAGKKVRNTIAQQLDSCCARASYKSDKQAYLVIQSWFDFHWRRWRSLPSSLPSSSQLLRRSFSVLRPATTTPACGRRRAWTGRGWSISKIKRGFKLLKQNVLILLNREGPREFDCPRFVIESTDQIWNMYRGIFKQ